MEYNNQRTLYEIAEEFESGSAVDRERQDKILSLISSYFGVSFLEVFKAAYAKLSNDRFNRATTSPIQDDVNHPKHYTNHPSGVECITVTEHFNFNRGNAIKYIWRAGEKSKEKEIEDLKKAEFYLKREIERLENADTSST